MISALRPRLGVQALGGACVVRAMLLTASDEVAEAQLGQRQIGGGLDWHVARRRQAAQWLEDDAPEWVWRINTDNAGVDDIAHEIINPPWLVVRKWYLKKA